MYKCAKTLVRIFLKFDRLQVWRSMPVHRAAAFRQGDFHQATPAGPCGALTGIGQVSCSVRGAQQPLARVVKETVGLIVHLHGYMGAPVEIGMRRSPVADCEGAACLPAINHIKGHCHVAFDKFGTATQDDGLFGREIHEWFVWHRVAPRGVGPGSSLLQQPIVQVAH